MRKQSAMESKTILEMQDIRKSFGDVVALDGVSVQVREREIHGLLGGNGAGKTTLMNILYGLYRPDGGEIRIEDRAVQIRSPRDAIEQGIGMVHQHFLQVETFTVAENIVLGTSLRNRPTVDLAEARDRIASLAEQFGLEVDPQAPVGALSMGVRQRVEVLKALYRGARLLILDEPTTNLTPQQVESLFGSLRKIVDEGLSVIFITHKLREVQAICDRVTVLRQGQNVLTVGRGKRGTEGSKEGRGKKEEGRGKTEEAFSTEELVRAMVGETMDVERSVQLVGAGDDVERLTAGNGDGGKLNDWGERRDVLRVQDLTVFGESGETPLLEGCSFVAREGEILGLAGVAGNGQNELAAALMGLVEPAHGEIYLHEEQVTTASTRALLEKGVAYVPENRLSDGYLPRATVAHNLLLGAHRRRRYSDGRMMNWKAIRRWAQELIEAFNIKTQGPEEAAGNLSGGNIQRLMLARALAHEPAFLIAHNPTQGLDIPSIEFVYSLLLERKEQRRSRPMATLLISEDEDELFLLCERIAVIYEGRIVGVLERAEFDKYALGRMMSGAGDNE